MANWCSGSLKVRGRYENVRRFFLEGIEDGYDMPQDEFIHIRDYDDCCHIAYAGGSSYVRDTHRAFLTENDVYLDNMGEDEPTIGVVDVEQAWDFRTEDWLTIAGMYDVDLRLYGFERGMEFNREIEIVDGKLTIDRVIKFNDYVWECPMPNIGG